MIDPVIVTILSSIFGGGMGVSLITWILKRIDRHDHLLTRDDLDKALAESPVIQEIIAKLENDYQRFNEIERNQLRSVLFEHTRSRLQHERQLEAGRDYLTKGGNGLGHARYEWLTHDYEQRLENNDWDYTTHHTS